MSGLHRRAPRVLVTGATGTVGRALVQRLLGHGAHVYVWTRDPARARCRLGPDVVAVPIEPDDHELVHALSTVDAVVNLAGESVIRERWTPARRRALLESRVRLTRRLGAAMERAAPTPLTLVSASAVGVYGDRGDQALTEQSSRGRGMLAELCAAWERAAHRARRLGTRVAVLRIGVVLSSDGGALPAMLPAFRLGVGGPLGDGTQVVPWIHLDDLLDVILRAIRDERMEGPINATAPSPATSRELATELGRVLHRPARLPVPAPLLRFALGERASVVLQSQRALPDRLERLGHDFRYPLLPEALRAAVEPARAVEIRRLTRDERASAPVPARYLLETRTPIPTHPEQCFGFFSEAANLGLITPAMLQFRILDAPHGALRDGSTIDYALRVGPMPLRWRSLIERWNPPSGFVDTQARGPYRGWWHEHRLERTAGGTLMTDRVYYAPPLGPLSAALNGLWIGDTLRSIFGYRAEAIGRLFPAPAGALALA